MRYRTFTGKTKQEALEQFNTEKKVDPSLKEARWIKHYEEDVTSFMGLKKDKVHNIVMAIPDAPIFDKPVLKESPALTGIEQSVLKETRRKKDITQTEEENNLFMLEGVNRLAEKISQQQTTTQPAISASLERGTKKAQELDTLKAELNNVRQEMKNMRNLLSTQMKNAQTVLFQNELEEDRSMPDELNIYKQHLRWIERYLIERDFSLYFIDAVTTHLEKTPEILREKNIILQHVGTFLQDNIPSQEILTEEYKHGNCIVFVGTTGVGKTSALIKCATHLGFMQKKSFQFLLLDKERKTTDSQLERFSGYVKSPLTCIREPEELIGSIKSNYDFTFIDTIGVTPQKIEDIKELTQWVNSIPQKTDIHLVVSATTKCSDLTQCYEAFQGLGINHLLITKLDEAKYLGSILSVAFQFKKPMSFLTDGQDVPGDLRIANITKLITESLK